MSEILKAANALIKKYRDVADEMFEDSKCRRIDEEEFIKSNDFDRIAVEDLFEETVELVRAIIDQDHTGRYYADATAIPGKTYEEWEDNKRKKIEDFYNQFTDEVKKIGSDN